jgi:carboxyl-terminal processing protease
MTSRSRTLILTLLTSSAVLGMTIGVLAQQSPKSPDIAPATTEKQADAKKTSNDINDDTYRQLNLFGEVFERVRAQYVDQVDDKQLVEYAINGMLSSLDPHSGYLNDDGLKDMQVQTRGEFGGLGIEVTQEDGLVKVVTPIDDTPAFKAGIQSGDLITHLDGKPMMGLKLNEAVDMLRGKVGSKITLTIRREGATEPLKITLVRDIIKIQSVRSRIEGDVGYIRITSFNDNTNTALIKAFEDIKKKVGNKLVGYVLDLRNNPGGLLEQAIAVSDAFLDKGEIVSTRGRNDRDTRRDNATPGDMADGLPVVALVNGGSASAAEIVAGALQDHHRAIVLGTQSFGKGSVQTVMPMGPNGAMKLTTARYYTPSGRSIQATGITPDIIVESAKIQADKKYDSVKEADLKGALANPNGDQGPENTEQTDETSSESDKSKKDLTPEELAKQDYQLQRALDLVRGISLYTNERPAPDTAVAKSDIAVDPKNKTKNKEKE